MLPAVPVSPLSHMLTVSRQRFPFRHHPIIQRSYGEP